MFSDERKSVLCKVTVWHNPARLATSVSLISPSWGVLLDRAIRELQIHANKQFEAKVLIQSLTHLIHHTQVQERTRYSEALVTLE